MADITNDKGSLDANPKSRNTTQTGTTPTHEEAAHKRLDREAEELANQSTKVSNQWDKEHERFTK